MNLSIVIPTVGQTELLKTAIRHIVDNRARIDTEIVVLDGNKEEGLDKELGKDVRVVRIENQGVYPTFQIGMNNTSAPIVAFFHSDLIIDSNGFDERIIREFETRTKLGLLGFVGSNELDASGGRGLGTVSNFQGKRYYAEFTTCTEVGCFDGVNDGHQHPKLVWVGSPAEAHGKRTTGSVNAAVIDGCAMVVRRKAWNEIGTIKDFPPHHFYDRLISCQMLEQGWDIEVLGIACDHISGQTVNKEPAYNTLAEEWSKKNLTPDKWVGNPPHYAWDETVYQEAERRFKSLYGDMLPTKIV